MSRAGNFRERALVQYFPENGGLDKYGNRVDAEWVDRGSFWADLRETPGREAIAAGRLEAPATGTLRLRKCVATEAIAAADRVKVRGHTWIISGAPIDPEGQGCILEFTLERGGAVE